MQSKLLVEGQAFQSWAILFEAGEEVITGLVSFARRNAIAAASFTAAGAFSRAILGIFDRQTRQYFRIPVEEDVEIVTVMGDISFEGENPNVHAQAALARSGGFTIGGHLLEGQVRARLHVIVSSPPPHVERRSGEGSVERRSGERSDSSEIRT